MNSNNHNNEPTFEQAFNRLEEIVKELENKDTLLEKSFSLFEEGQKIIKDCNMMLDKAEKRLKILTETDSGFEVKEESFD